MDAKGFVVPPGGGSILNMRLGDQPRSSCSAVIPVIRRDFKTLTQSEA